MSKVIYLNGDETLVLTREMVLGHRDTTASPLNDWEAMVMLMIATAHRYLGVVVVGEYDPRQAPSQNAMHSLVAELLKSRFFNMYSSRYLFRVYTSEMVFQFHNKHSPNNGSELKRIDLGWNYFP